MNCVKREGLKVVPKTNKMGASFVRQILLALAVALAGGFSFGGDADKLRDLEASCTDLENVIWRSRKCVLNAAKRGDAKTRPEYIRSTLDDKTLAEDYERYSGKKWADFARPLEKKLATVEARLPLPPRDQSQVARVNAKYDSLIEKLTKELEVVRSNPGTWMEVRDKLKAARSEKEEQLKAVELRLDREEAKSKEAVTRLRAFDLVVKEIREAVETGICKPIEAKVAELEKEAAGIKNRIEIARVRAEAAEAERKRREVAQAEAERRAEERRVDETKRREQAPFPPQSEDAEGGIPWLKVVAWIVGVWLVLKLLRAIFRQKGGTNYNPAAAAASRAAKSRAEFLAFERQRIVSLRQRQLGSVRSPYSMQAGEVCHYTCHATLCETRKVREGSVSEESLQQLSRGQLVVTNQGLYYVSDSYVNRVEFRDILHIDVDCVFGQFAIRVTKRRGRIQFFIVSRLAEIIDIAERHLGTTAVTGL